MVHFNYIPREGIVNCLNSPKIENQRAYLAPRPGFAKPTAAKAHQKITIVIRGFTVILPQ